MKKSISTWSFPATMNLVDRMALAADAGFQGFELDVSDDGAITCETTSAQLKEIKAMADHAGLVLSGLATGMYWSRNPVSDDAETRKRAARVLNRQLEIASELGIDAILVVPGVVGADFLPDEQPVPYGEAYKRAQDFIANALPQATSLRVSIGVENVWNRFLQSPLELCAFIDSFGSSHVGSYFDTGNVLATGYPEHWIAILEKRIRRVHFKDYRRNVGSVDGFVDLLSGDTNWPAVVRSLREINYEGWVAAEMIPPAPFYRYAPEVLIYNTSRAMDAIFKL